MNSKVYKWCAVPQCGNTTIKTPNKLFVYLPHKKATRDKWVRLARRDPTGILPRTHLYFCEDHFDLPNDMENYMEYHLMGSVSQVRMKPGCVPTKYQCQSDRRKQTSDATKQPYILKKQRKILVEECKKDVEERTIAEVKVKLELGENSCGSSTRSASPVEVRVKIEREGDGASETSDVSLFTKHEIKVELELEEEHLQPKDIAFNIQQCTIKQEPPPADAAEEPPSGRSRAGQTPLHACTTCHKAFRQDSSLASHKCSSKRQKCRRNSCLMSRSRSSSPGPEERRRRPQSTQQVDITQNTRGAMKRKAELEQSIYVSALERAAACDLDDKGEAAVEERYDHVKKWVSELPPPGTMGIIPSCSKPSSEASCDVISGTVSVHPAEQPQSQSGPSGDHTASQLTSDAVDARPSTSGTTATSIRPAAGLVAYGSEIDSDFDDKFDLNEIAANAAITRGIPEDEDLDEPVSNVINSMERELDEAIERLVNTSNVFEWEADFGTFRGVPETFSGPTPGAIKDYDTPYDAFTDIWSRDIMEHIARETNRYANKVIADKIAAGTLGESSRLRRWVDTDVDELYVLFAVYILMGVVPRRSQLEYFKSGGYLEMPRFRELLTYSRFLMLDKFLHFEDNPDESQELPQSDTDEFSARLRKIDPVLSHLNAKFQSIYNLHQDVAVDESLTLSKNRLSWVQALRSKPARFGIKSYELCEPRTGFMYKFIITGKNSERGNVTACSAELSGKSAEAVLTLLKDLGRRGHRVAMDNFYNSPALARHLKSLGFDCLGTLRPSRKNVPKDIAEASNVSDGTIIARHSGDVSCIAWKDTKMVNMISTYHYAETFVGSKAGRPLVKPVVVQDYNDIIGGLEIKDQKLSIYLVDRKRCLKWYMKIFKRLLNVSVHNALVLLLSSWGRRNMPKVTHRDFREHLANSLVAAHLRSPRENLVPIPEIMRLRKDIVHVPEYLDRNSRMRCHICRRKGKDKHVRLKCVTCDEGMCAKDCWKDWHSLQELPGNIVHVRKRRRRC